MGFEIPKPSKVEKKALEIGAEDLERIRERIPNFDRLTKYAQEFIEEIWGLSQLSDEEIRKNTKWTRLLNRFAPQLNKWFAGSFKSTPPVEKLRNLPENQALFTMWELVRLQTLILRDNDRQRAQPGVPVVYGKDTEYMLDNIIRKLPNHPSISYLIPDADKPKYWNRIKSGEYEFAETVEKVKLFNFLLSALHLATKQGKDWRPPVLEVTIKDLWRYGMAHTQGISWEDWNGALGRFFGELGDYTFNYRGPGQEKP